MGTSGAAMFADDVAADVRDEYLSLLAGGATDKKALDAILANWDDSIADTDDGPIVWLALAATQWEYGRLNPSVKAHALQVIDQGEDSHRWVGSVHEKRRRQVLQRLKTKLQSKQPKKRQPRKRSIPDPESFSAKSPDQTAEATACELPSSGQDNTPFSQVIVVMQSRGREGGGGVFTVYCHHTDLRLKWLDNDTLQIAYPKSATVGDQKEDRSFYYGRTVTIVYCCH